jgi:hypothetical protein
LGKGGFFRGGDQHVDGLALKGVLRFLVTTLNLGNVKFGLGDPDFIGSTFKGERL